MKMKTSIESYSLGSRDELNYQGEIIREQINHDLTIRILTPFPDSEFVMQREKDENCVKGEIRKSIKDLIIWAKDTNYLYPKQNNPIQIKYYKTLPLESYMRIDNRIFVGPFMVNKISQLTIAYEFKGNSKGFEYYNSYFDELWNHTELVKKAL
jgi:hypothetical protein